MTTNEEAKNTAQAESTTKKRLAVLSLAALGIVYGDIGTSPLYAVRECFHGDFGIETSPANILGVLSLMFWSLMLIVSLKYLAYVLRADNNGEGGVIVLAALVTRTVGLSGRGRVVLLAMGLFAASLLYGDGMITPAISVLSAVEGIRIITPALESYVVPITVIILIMLFALQKRGTRGIGTLFGPVTMIWLTTIAVLGISGIVKHPQILTALFPWHAITFLLNNSWHGFLVLGAVFLVVTGAEALYADLGHFGTRPIRLAWVLFVLPALLCSYFGQGALLLARPEESYHPFYALAPGWSLIPLVMLATLATIIASQAVISGAFSLTRQAIQLGYLPRLRVIHTSATEIGQIYVPQINWFLMLATVGLVVGFQSSSHLAAAYGVAVTTTMTVTTILLYVIARNKWQWSKLKARSLCGLFLVVDLAFLSANLGKIAHGAWFPLAIGAFVYLLMVTWRRGRTIVARKLYDYNLSLEEFIKSVTLDPPVRVPGQAVYLAGRPDATPPALLHNLKHNRVLHSEVAILTVRTEEIPTVPREEKVKVEELGHSFYRITARHGFMEDPIVPHFLAMANEQGLGFEIEKVSFILGRERLLPDRKPLMPFWQENIFSFISHNTVGPTAYFQIPPKQVIEIGSQVEI